VGALAEAVARGGGAPSQSALSQHLARLRAEGLVTARRDAHTVWYRLADPRIERLLAVLTAFPCAHCGNPVPDFEEMRQ
jgi:ArsR family transcriptional regulator